MHRSNWYFLNSLSGLRARSTGNLSAALRLRPLQFEPFEERQMLSMGPEIEVFREVVGGDPEEVYEYDYVYFDTQIKF